MNRWDRAERSEVVTQKCEWCGKRQHVPTQAPAWSSPGYTACSLACALALAEDRRVYWQDLRRFPYPPRMVREQAIQAHKAPKRHIQDEQRFWVNACLALRTVAQASHATEARSNAQTPIQRGRLMGLGTRQPKRLYTPEDIAWLLQEWAQRHGHVPTAREMNRAPDLPAYHTVVAAYGSMRACYAQLGWTVGKAGRPTHARASAATPKVCAPAGSLCATGGGGGV